MMVCHVMPKYGVSRDISYLHDLSNLFPNGPVPGHQGQLSLYVVLLPDVEEGLGLRVGPRFTRHWDWS